MPSTNCRALHDEVLARPRATERLAELREETLAEIGLHALRRTLDRSQADLAAELDISQSAVSQLERGDDVRVSTLRSYVHGLGARLQIMYATESRSRDVERVSIPARSTSDARYVLRRGSRSRSRFRGAIARGQQRRAYDTPTSWLSHPLAMMCVSIRDGQGHNGGAIASDWTEWGRSDRQ